MSNSATFFVLKSGIITCQNDFWRLYCIMCKTGCSNINDLWVGVLCYLRTCFLIYHFRCFFASLLCNYRGFELSVDLLLCEVFALQD